MKRSIKEVPYVLLVCTLFCTCTFRNLRREIPVIENALSQINPVEKKDTVSTSPTAHKERVLPKDTLPVRIDNSPKIKVANKCIRTHQSNTSLRKFIKQRKYEVDFSDTLFANSNSSTLFYNDILSRTRIITTDDAILLEDPSIEYVLENKKEKKVYYIETANRSRRIDFSNPEDIRSLRDFDKRDPQFQRFTKDYYTHISYENQTTAYTFTLDFPKPDYPYAQILKKWLVQQVNEAYVGSVEDVDSAKYVASRKKHPARWTYQDSVVTAERLGSFSANRYFAFKKMEYPEYLSASAYLCSANDWRLCVSTDRFVTYQAYHFYYNGGTHGDYSSTLHSFDLVHGKEIDSTYLFKAKSIDKVKALLLEEAFYNPMYRLKEGIATMNDICWQFAKVGNGDVAATVQKMKLPHIGLSEEGVVFSYEPYDIGCYASGTFHFIISYGRLLPYLTDQAKWCMGIE